MSTLSRLASGNLAQIASMFVNILVQVALLPIYLRFWNTEQYGLWLVLNTATSLMTLVDAAHQDFVGFECMQLPTSERARRGQILSDSVPVVVIMGAVQLLCLAIAVFSPLSALFMHAPKSAELDRSFRLSMVGLMAVWWVSQNFAGTIGRVLGSVGHFATSAWWGVMVIFATNAAPVLAVALGAGLGGASLALGLATVAIDLLIYRHYFSIMKREGLAFGRPDLRAGFLRYRHALVLSLSSILEFMQQTGVRLLLLPLLGVVRLVQFSTLRTVANVAQQGVGTMILPTVPELMRFIAARDQAKSSTVLVGMIFVTVIFAAPGLVILQLIGQLLFTAWTLHKVPFDGAAFAVLSATVLVFALSQPSRAVVRGNNLVRSQAFVSLAAGVVLLAAAALATPRFGVLGAACALLAAETVRSLSNIAIAAQWFSKAGLNYPARPMIVAGAFVVLTIGVMLAMAALPGIKVLIVAAYAPVWAGANLLLWRMVPAEHRGLILEAGRGLLERGSNLWRRRPGNPSAV